MSGAISNPRIISAIAKLRRSDGRILPEDVVEAARSRSSPLHDQFDWNDTVAARKWRIEQARELLRVTVTLIPGVKEPIRAFVSLSNEKGYRMTVNVLANTQQRNQLLAVAMSEMKVFERKYGHLVELVGVIKSMRSLLKELAAA